ncbi:MAG: heavy metal-binding domain-containing protein [Actinomycetota bacterium]|nr:MAG: heavy metal-binding domain-containing protein [Actinomycetota bacterium]
MPLFRQRKQNSQTKQPQEDPAQSLPKPVVDDPAAAQQALENGQLVPAAMRRLMSLSDQKSFTSDLTINEFSLVKSSGLHPICQVAGTAVYKIGYQQMPYGGSQPLSVLSEAFNEARRLAVKRLEQEAALAHADGVVGVRITQGMFDAESGLIEFSMIGTAVKSLNGLMKNARDNPSSRPVLTTLSGQDVHLLLENGISPAGLVGASSCYLATLSISTYQQMYSMFGPGSVNFEIKEFTQGYYASRQIVMRDVEKAAKSLGASGIIDFRFHSNTNSYQLPGSNSENVGAVSFTTHVLATAITQAAYSTQPKPQKILFVSP